MVHQQEQVQSPICKRYAYFDEDGAPMVHQQEREPWLPQDASAGATNVQEGTSPETPRTEAALQTDLDRINDSRLTQRLQGAQDRVAARRRRKSTSDYHDKLTAAARSTDVHSAARAGNLDATELVRTGPMHSLEDQYAGCRSAQGLGTW